MTDCVCQTVRFGDNDAKVLSHEPGGKVLHIFKVVENAKAGEYFIYDTKGQPICSSVYMDTAPGTVFLQCVYRARNDQVSCLDSKCINRRKMKSELGL